MYLTTIRNGKDLVPMFTWETEDNPDFHYFNEGDVLFFKIISKSVFFTKNYDSEIITIEEKPKHV